MPGRPFGETVRRHKPAPEACHAVADQLIERYAATANVS
jgi:hypothetical protein